MVGIWKKEKERKKKSGLRFVLKAALRLRKALLPRERQEERGNLREVSDFYPLERRVLDKARTSSGLTQPECSSGSCDTREQQERKSTSKASGPHQQGKRHHPPLPCPEEPLNLIKLPSL